MSFCFLYNVVLENHSVQNSPWGGGGGSIASSRSKIIYAEQENREPVANSILRFCDHLMIHT